jgi:hypothetical protein
MEVCDEAAGEAICYVFLAAMAVKLTAFTLLVWKKVMDYSLLRAPKGIDSLVSVTEAAQATEVTTADA